ncbi:hypothetical protein [Pseudaquabacterium pictum]|uniref:Uncharacterized protein n=1 Tax=Pseudaquabacterium pictum TaxID=2315236 RepID=A0A480AR17_9BURK|nr:hypothetical protein [Rubrivivax pictus]GCL63883.1 hypothetical protein AQPW35_29640 [Rubrivivax pictus]
MSAATWLPLAGLRWGLALAWRMRAGLIAGRGRVHKRTPFTHNAMAACPVQWLKGRTRAAEQATPPTAGAPAGGPR